MSFSQDVFVIFLHETCAAHWDMYSVMSLTYYDDIKLPEHTLLTLLHSDHKRISISDFSSAFFAYKRALGPCIAHQSPGS